MALTESEKKRFPPREHAARERLKSEREALILKDREKRKLEIRAARERLKSERKVLILKDREKRKLEIRAAKAAMRPTKK